MVLHVNVLMVTSNKVENVSILVVSMKFMILQLEIAFVKKVMVLLQVDSVIYVHLILILQACFQDVFVILFTNGILR